MRKLLSMLLAVMLLALPVTGMAASPAEMLDAAWAEGKTLSTTVTFGIGDLPLDEETKTVVNDLVNALGFRTVTDPSGKTQFALTLQNQDALAVAAEPAEGEFYLNTAFLSGSTMAFNAEEAKVVVDRLLDMLGEAADMSAAEIAQMKAAFGTGFEAGYAAGATAVEAVEVPDIDLTALMGLATQLTASMESGAVTEQPAESCDEAIAYAKMTVTPAMIKDVLTVVCELVKATPDAMESLRNADIDWEINGRRVTLDTFLSEAPDALAEGLKETYGDIPVYMLLNAAGELVYMDVVMTPVDGGDTAKLIYARKTGAESVVHNVKVLEDDEGAQITLTDACAENETAYYVDIYEIDGAETVKMLGVKFDQHRDYSDTVSYENTSLLLSVPTGESAMPFVTVMLSMAVRGAVEGEKVYCDTNVNLGADILGWDLLTMQVNTVADDTVIPSIATENAVRPGAMTDEEFAEFANGTTNYMTTGLFTIMQLLPQSVLALLLN